jgi:dephospho-CoA kinase
MKSAKTIIGITGNIATGKSVVRRMLANAGALSLDADLIAHRIIYPQGQAYQQVVAAFDKSILTENGEISRPKLGKIVFHEPSQLAKLEHIVHPAVSEAVQKRIDGSQAPVIALEAIKLLEAGLDKICDAIWVSHAPEAVQLERLLQIRGLTEEEAHTRLAAQPPQAHKLNQADVIVHTDGPFEATWSQIQAGLNDTIQVWDQPADLSQGWTAPAVIQIPLDELIQFWDKHTASTGESLYEALGLGMVQPLTRHGQLAALLRWKNWNFTATLTQVLPAEILMKDTAAALEGFTAAARQQECELLMLRGRWIETYHLTPNAFGFDMFEPEVLTYPAWRSAAQALADQDQDWNSFWALFLARPLEAL